jgi:RimJ/RimL family protein N-acetyltransferase
MIRGRCSVIRTAEQDDAAALHAAYTKNGPLACLLDQRREILFPNLDEVRETLGRRKELEQVPVYAVEDLDGIVRGFCSLRGVGREVSYSEFIIMLIDAAKLETPLAGEAFEFLAGRAFRQMGLNKIVSHALDDERILREYLVRCGFRSDGIQREVVYTEGRYHNLEAFTLFAADAPAHLRISDAADARG